MLIDQYAAQCLDVLYSRVPDSHTGIYLLIDSAFIHGAHRVFESKEKGILFDTLPSCNDVTRDVSPFVIEFEPADRRQRVLLKRCSGWPMVSVIETSESLAELSSRLAAWCVIEVGDQRFNFRFPDTRRLPAIFKTLTHQQRAMFVGPMKRWSYVARNGWWEELTVSGESEEGAAEPILDERQFADLVDDSRADELLMLLRDRGHEVYSLPSRSHSLVTTALRAASIEALQEDDVLQWCAWYWERDKIDDDIVAASLLQSWREKAL